MEDVGILYVPLVKFTANRHFLWLFGTFSPPLFWYIFTRFGILYQEKSGNPALGYCTHIMGKNMTSSQKK
jgi:hypothetical protein